MYYAHILTTLREILAHIRMPQFFFFAAAFALGIGTALYAAHATALLFTDLATTVRLSILGAIITYLLWAASCMTNDIYDVAIDRISNPQRPLPRHVVSTRVYHIIALSANFAALALAYTLGKTPLLLCLVSIIIHYAYNMPPLRLKRVPFVATLLGSTSIQIVIFMGFWAAVQHYHLTTTYPYTLGHILFAIVTVSLIIPLKDIKDIDGDRANGISTFPVLFGVRATIFIAALAASIYLYTPFFVTDTLTPPVVAGVTLVVCVMLSIVYSVTLSDAREKRPIAPHKILAWLTVPALLYLGILLAIFL